MKRYVLQSDISDIEKQFGIQNSSEFSFKNNFNIMPGAAVPIIVEQDGVRKLVEASWGLPTGKSGEELTSIEQEEILKDENLKQFVSASCIILASGFYKWKKTVRDPLPFYLRVLSQEILPLAGIYSSTKNNNGPEFNFSVLTMPANALVEPLDKSMPCILGDDEVNNWLSEKSIKMLEKGFSGQHLLPDMAVYRVPDLVNDPSNNSKELIQPIPKLREDDD